MNVDTVVYTVGIFSFMLLKMVLASLSDADIIFMSITRIKFRSILTKKTNWIQ